MPLVLREKVSEDADMGIWEITETAEQLSNEFLFLPEDQVFYNSLKAGKRKLHWLSSRVLLRKLLGSAIPAEIRTDVHDKPHLTNFPHHFSISHSASHAAVIISKAHRVGIDIEEIQPKIERIARKFLSVKELSYIAEGSDRIQKLYTCWSAKEALYKLQGEKNVSFKDNIHLAPFTYFPEGFIEAILVKEDVKSDFYISYRAFGSYMLAWVVE